MTQHSQVPWRLREQRARGHACLPVLAQCCSPGVGQVVPPLTSDPFLHSHHGALLPESLRPQTRPGQSLVALSFPGHLEPHSEPVCLPTGAPLCRKFLCLVRKAQGAGRVFLPHTASRLWPPERCGLGPLCRLLRCSLPPLLLLKSPLPVLVDLHGGLHPSSRPRWTLRFPGSCRKHVGHEAWSRTRVDRRTLEGHRVDRRTQPCRDSRRRERLMTDGLVGASGGPAGRRVRTCRPSWGLALVTALVMAGLSGLGAGHPVLHAESDLVLGYRVCTLEGGWQWVALGPQPWSKAGTWWRRCS